MKLQAGCGKYKSKQRPIQFGYREPACNRLMCIQNFTVLRHRARRQLWLLCCAVALFDSPDILWVLGWRSAGMSSQ